MTMKPMQNMSTDLFHVNGDPYIVLVDRYSSFIWTSKIKDETTSTVIEYLEKIFYDFGFPKRLRSDGGPCFRGKFTSWCEENYVIHELSSAYYSQSNGLAEISVKKAKRLVQKTKKLKENLQRAIFQMRNTRLKSVGASPSELFYRREMRNPLPNLPRELNLEDAIMRKEMNHVDPRRKKTSSVMLRIGERVEVQNHKTKRWDMKGTVMRMRESGVSYYVLIDGEERSVLRNRKFLRPSSESRVHGATQLEQEVMAGSHVIDSEIHSLPDMSACAQADAILERGGGALCGRKCNGEQRTRQEHSLSAARHAQARGEQDRVAARQPAHSPTNTDKEGLGRATRSQTKALEKNRISRKVRFALENNEYF